MGRARHTLAGPLLSALAAVWRRFLFRTRFVAITGSLGKTTTTRMTAGILESQFSISSTIGANNSRLGLARAILRTRPHHRFAILEVGTKRPGALLRAAWLADPDVVVILNVARTHLEYFASLDDIAAEKKSLASRMGRKGVLILNGDDPRVGSLAAGFPGRVRTFGTSPDHDLWADSISSQWPGRLEFTVHARDRSVRVRTQLVGEHWVYGALAALSVAIECGMDLEAAAARIGKAEAYLGRMQPVPVPSGAMFLRDDFSPSPDSWFAALRVINAARAERRIVTLGDLDQPGVPVEERMALLGETSAGKSDMAVFFGTHSELAAAAAIRAGMRPETVHAFPSQKEAGEFLRNELRAGDLVLLRPSMTDHPERIYYAQFGEVGCARYSCLKTHLCDACPELKPSLEKIAEVPENARPRWNPG